MKSRVSFTAVANLLPAKIKGQKSKLQNLSKTIDGVFLKNWLHSFLGFISWDWSHLSSKSSFYYFLSVLDECKCFLEINLIKESCSLIETLLKPHTLSLDDKFHSNILTFSLKYRNHNIVLEKKIIASM